jgi:hypothetical protein
MNWIAESYIAGSGLISVFIVLILLYAALLLLRVFVGKLEAPKTSGAQAAGKK